MAAWKLLETRPPATRTTLLLAPWAGSWVGIYDMLAMEVFACKLGSGFG